MIYGTREEARRDIIDYIDVFYNRAWRRSHLGGVSLEAFEQSLVVKTEFVYRCGVGPL